MTKAKFMGVTLKKNQISGKIPSSHDQGNVQKLKVI